MPTPWMNNLVITEKQNGTLRVYLDPKPLDIAIKRERCEILAPADVQADMQRHFHDN